MNVQPILVLDEDEDDRVFIGMAFRAAHIRNPLVLAHDGADTIEYLSGTGRYADRSQHPLPTLVLVDLKTPRKTGLDVLRWIRSQPELRTMVVIVLTASPNPVDINAAYAAGANAYLVKPNGLDRLKELVHAIQVFWLVQNRFPTSEGL